MSRQDKNVKSCLCNFSCWSKCLIGGFYLLLVVLLGLDVMVSKHPTFTWEKWFGFHAAFGLIACILLVLVARYLLRPLVMRDEEYYDR